MISEVAAIALAMIGSVLVAAIAFLAYGHHLRNALSYFEKEQRLPDATKYHNLQHMIEQLKEEYDEIRDQMHDARDLIEEADRRRQWLEQTKEEIERLESDKQEIHRIQNELETQQVKLAELLEQKERAEAQLRTHQEDESKLKETIASLRAEAEKAEALKNDVSELEFRKSKLAQEQLEIDQKLAQTARECETARSERERLEKLVAGLENRVEVIKEDIVAKEAEAKQISQRLIELQQKEQVLLRKIEELRSEERKAEEIRKSIAELENQRSEFEKAFEEIKKNKESEFDKLVSQIKDQKRELDAAEKRAEEKKQSLRDVESKLTEMWNQEKELREERKRLLEETEKLAGRKAAIEGQIPPLQQVLDSVAGSVSAQTGGVSLEDSELWHPVLSSDNQTSRSPDELKTLQNLGGILASLGLRFDQRTLFAFHTALKSTGSSPLVTLAGVSGTGKSELPRRYSEALGIHFLNVAVQPRWDSPQDLFGFYDYLEQRFRPTELTRALLQMDPVGPEEGRGWSIPNEYGSQRVNDEMLLVLLDEMNLARVEYYFSEFLSKLETRRGVEYTNKLRRQHAEIVLEVAGRGSNSMPLRMFVDRNVLFVGTMNEDESTQALSDKVIDRSNLLRFGSPSQIDPLRSHSRNGRRVEESPKLLFTDWQAWCRNIEDLESEDEDRLMQWIASLRGALNAVGRPFAYRVTNAMLEYAANYPMVENRIEHAMADQIEQRILPKLIGLDMHHSSSEKVIEVVANVLDDVGDDELKKRIQSSNDQDYFQWTGLDRTAVEANAY